MREGEIDVGGKGGNGSRSTHVCACLCVCSCLCVCMFACVHAMGLLQGFILMGHHSHTVLYESPLCTSTENKYGV